MGSYWRAVKVIVHPGIRSGKEKKILCVWRDTHETPQKVLDLKPPFSIEEATEEEYERFQDPPPLVVEYLHCDKDSMRGTGETLGLTEEQTNKLITALYEVRFVVDVTMGTIVAVDGKILETARDYEGPE